MAQIVTDASGQTHSFPDEATPAMIAEALGLSVRPEEVSAAPPQDTSVLRVPRMVGEAALRGVIHGLGAPGDILPRLPPEQYGEIAFRSDPTGLALNAGFPTTNELLDVAARTGLPVGQASRLPQTQFEKGLVGTVEGAASTIPSLALGGPEAIIPALVAGGAGGGVTALTGNEAAGAVAGLLSGGGATAAMRLATGRLGPNALALAEAGLPARTATMTSESPTVRRVLGTAAPTGEIEQDFINSLGESARQLGTSRTYEEAGTYAQQRARDWIENTFPVKQEAAWAPVNAAIPPDAPTGLDNFANTLKSVTTSGGKLAPLEKMLRPSLPERLKTVLLGKEPGTADILPAPRIPAPQVLKPGGPINPPRGAVPQPPPLQPMGTTGIGTGPVDWQDAGKLQSALGDAMHDPQLVKDIGEKNLSRLYAALSQDRKAVALARGVGDEFDAANIESTRLHAFRQNVVSKIVSAANQGQETIEPGQVTKTFLAPGRLGVGGSELAVLNTEMPDVTGEFASAKLARIAGLDDPSTPKESVSKAFAREWDAMSPEAKTALVTDPATRARLDATYAATKLVPGGAGGKMATTLGHSAALFLGFEGGREGIGLAGHLFGIPGQSLVPEEAGALLGAAGPAAFWMAKNRLASSAALAEYAGRASPMRSALQLPAATALGVTAPGPAAPTTTNPLSPQ